MDSSLNRAHQWNRKADSLSASGKYDEAITCHNRAAENLLDTLQSPVLYDNPSLMSCLRQQHEFHLKQVKLLQSRQLRCANMEARKTLSVTTRSKGVQTENLTNRCSGMRQENVLVNTQNIEESIREADTMLRFLKRRSEDPEFELALDNLHRDPAAGSAESGADVTVVAVKKPKDDTVIIEELRCLTGELQAHIKQLVQESEWLKAQNQRLTKQLSQQQGGEGGEESAEDLMPLTTQFSMASSFTLPPLDTSLLHTAPKLSSDSEDDLSDRL